MYKSSPFLFALFISTVAAAQQTTVDKSTQSLAQTDVNISAAAIPFEDAVNVVIDSATYHKAVQAGIEPERATQVVEIFATAIRMNEHIQGEIPKEAINEKAEVQRKEIIIRSERAQPVKPQ